LGPTSQATARSASACCKDACGSPQAGCIRLQRIADKKRDSLTVQTNHTWVTGSSFHAFTIMLARHELAVWA